MNFNLMSVTLVVAGAVLMWAAIKDEDPRTLIQNALQGKGTGDITKGVGKVPAPGTRQKGTENGGLVVPFVPKSRVNA